LNLKTPRIICFFFLLPSSKKETVSKDMLDFFSLAKEKLNQILKRHFKIQLVLRVSNSKKINLYT
tara:strand:- start:1013 stop:1207 length:195 start_codon:yes stop_codon:yes gene_type:complete